MAAFRKPDKHIYRLQRTTGDLLRSSEKFKNRLFTAHFSLIGNILSPGLACVDLADLLCMTVKSRMMYVILEKQHFEKEISFKFLINEQRIPKEIRSVWVDLQIGSAYKNKHSEITDMVLTSLQKKFLSGIEIILVDTMVDNQRQNAISIVGYD